MRDTPSILIPAAGASSRMLGRDKLMEMVDGVPLLRLIAMRAIDTGFSVTIALSPDRPERRAALSDLPVTLVDVPDWADGMSATLKRGVQNLSGDVMIVLADMPNITTEMMVALADGRNGHAQALIWRGVTDDGAAGHPILFDHTLIPEFANLSGDQGAAPIVKRHQDRVAMIKLGGSDARLDLDTPEDWEQFRQETGR